jgi:hypothetical protein
MTHEQYNTGREPGRPSRMSQTVVTNILNTLSNGLYVTTACQYAGIAPSTYSLWRRRGEAEYERLRQLGHDPEALLQAMSTDADGKTISAAAILGAVRNDHSLLGPFDTTEGEYAIFLYHSERALAVSEVRNITLIQQAASDGQWQAAAWLNERRHPERWGRRERVNLEGPTEGSNVQVDHTVSVDQLDAAIRRIAGEGSE